MYKSKIKFYNQKGDGVGFIDKKPFYIPFTILNEEVEFKIIQEFDKYGIGKVVRVLEPSNNRNYNLPENYKFIGGYELIHMKPKAEKEFKIYIVKQEFQKNANYDLKNIEFHESPKEFRYRNKITLFDGGLMKKNTNEIIKVEDFLLTDIKPYTDIPGKVIIRKLDTTIMGTEKNSELYTTDTMIGLKFKVSLTSFYQVNKEVAISAYQEIINHINKEDIVLDLYSGIGTISLLAAKNAKKVIGVEISKSSFDDAMINKEKNNIDNVEFYNFDAKDSFIKLKNIDKINTIILDPGRAGANKYLLFQIIDYQIPKIIYLSCNPATQAADFKILKNYYNLEKVKIFNMFPKTRHIENLIILSLKDAKLVN